MPPTNAQRTSTSDGSDEEPMCGACARWCTMRNVWFRVLLGTTVMSVITLGSILMAWYIISTRASDPPTAD
ncbi:Protein of unknown function [Gryllus bimaculatus]|nr:Protein of unknown function [Gryllus bimaculatus]